MAAARLPARRLPARSQFDLSTAIGRICFSTQLFEIGTSPSLTKCLRRSLRKLLQLVNHLRHEAGTGGKECLHRDIHGGQETEIGDAQRLV